MVSPYSEGAESILGVVLPQSLGFRPGPGAKTGGPDPILEAVLLMEQPAPEAIGAAGG